MKHLILVGACYLDTILTVPQFPEEDSKLRAKALQVRRGGNCPNTLEVLQQLLISSDAQHHQDRVHIRPYLVSCLPDRDAAATDKILSSFGGGRDGGDDENAVLVDFSHCLYRKGHDEPASSYIIRSIQNGSRTIVNYNDLPEMTTDEFKGIADAFAAEHSDEESWWHFEGRIPETTLGCIQYLRRILPKSTISVEVEKPNREGLVELAAEADTVFYSKSWAESRGYHSPEECLRAEAPSTRATVLLCTWGAEGAASFCKPSGEYIHGPANQPGEPISVVDTIGAGDTFIAGMLYGLHNETWSREAKLAFAVGLATKKVQIEGFAHLTS
ncbi:Ketohexokinase [Podospora australis]|uniref:Ketohexokinase n=1 Tax=Podospora australis TaxID=1536484 RepID=A0AAN6X2U5_9PEZI|nr:Ketohexokinase [Podospora australis]